MTPLARRSYAAATARHPALTFLVRALTGFLLGYMVALAFGMLGFPLILGPYAPVHGLPLAIAGAIIGVTPLRALLWAVLWMSVAVAIAVGYTPFLTGRMQAMVRRDPLPDSADAIVTLSSGLSNDGMLDMEGVDRLLTAARLLRVGTARTLVLSRLHMGTSGRLTSDADQDRILMLLPTVPEKIYVDSVHSTHDEAIKVAAVAKRRGWRRVVLVTSPLHTRRACATFERAGVHVACTPSDSRDVAIRSLSTYGDRMRAFQLWLYETLGTWKYRLKGWVA